MASKFLLLAVLGSVLAACSAWQRSTKAHDYILAATKPDRLFVIDPDLRKVISEFRIPGAHGYVSGIVPSPDGKIAYVLINRMDVIAGIDLRSGREVFGANLDSPGERVTCMFAFDVTPDGKELIVYVNRTRLELDEYKVEAPRFLIFSTAGGLDAKPLQEFPAPRRISMILARKDGRSFFALGFNLYEYGLKTGRRIEERGISEWDRPSYSTPDMLALWPASEPAGVFVDPVYATRSGPGTPPDGVLETSLMTLDLRSGQLEFHDIGPTAGLIMSTALTPDRHWIFGGFENLLKIDARHWAITGQVPLPHAYYTFNVSLDGGEVYVGGAMCDIRFFDARTLAEQGDVRLPGCGDQALTSVRVIRGR